MTNGQAEADGREFVRGLDRGLAVIRAFDADAPRLSLADVARRTDLSRASARRFLHTLESLGYVETDGRTYALTPRILELGHHYLASLTLPEVAGPHLERLSQRLGESCSVAVLDGTEIVYVARAIARRIMSVNITIGTRFPASATSMGRVLLAGLEAEERASHLGDLLPLTPHTVTDPTALGSELDRVGAQGFALVDQELELGLRSIAAPIVEAGRTVAAINVSTQAGLVSASAAIDATLPPLLETAQAISADLASLRDRRS